MRGLAPNVVFAAANDSKGIPLPQLILDHSKEEEIRELGTEMKSDIRH